LVSRDSVGGLIVEYDKSNNRSSMITNDVRVYKGASWKDRAYWLDPAQRRYMPEYMSTDFIGFRCAMSYLGSKPKSLNRTPKSKTAKK
jgi:formylglycine-generating enzyme required for sulfatase activity